MEQNQPETNILLGGTGRKPRATQRRQPPQQQPPQPLPLAQYQQKSVGAISCPPQKIHILSVAENATTITKKERDQILTETAKKEAELQLLTIAKSAISLYSFEQMKDICGNIQVTKLNLQDHGSVNDPRMGVASLNVSCQKCSQIDCPGHFGLIEFHASIYNPAFIREIVSVLTCVCNDCGGLLVTEDVMKQRDFFHLSYDKRLSALEDYCKDISCLRQKTKTGGGRIVPCSKNPTFITTDIKEKGEITYKIPQQGSKKVNKEDAPHLMTISQVTTILDRISPEDSILLGFPADSHPRNMILRGILVPPVIARPPVYEGGSIHHDKLTRMYVAIVRKVQDLTNGKPGAANEVYNALKQLIFKTDGKKMGMHDFLSIVERIQGKQALLRGLLMGKRVNYCARTVAGPDPSLKYGQLRVPESWAPVITKPIKVTDFNIREMTRLLEAGKITHITVKKTGLRKFCQGSLRYRLQRGDIVERWLQNGDRVVNNRQPTLHRQSMMAYEVVLGYQLTIGLHLSYTTPMNCDFDGDENNIWCPQDFEVEAECEILMNVKNNIMSSEQNRPIMGLVMNSVSGAYLLSEPSTRLDNDLFAELLTLVTNQKPLDTLYSRLIKYGVHPRSGQAVFSSMLPEDFYYEQKGVLIMEGILFSGRLKKSHVGTSHRSIIQELYKKYGTERTADFFTDAPWVINKWLMERGFSVGMSDMINLAIDEKTGEEYDKNKRILEQELAKIYVQLEALGSKHTDPIEESFRQRQINNLVNVAQGIGLRLAKEVLSGDNSIGVMTDQGAGTKGGIANIGQMMGSVGQQFYRSERLKPTISGGKRLLPTYDENDNNPEAHAFIPVSFFTGLSPEGLFFLQAGGREGLLDTALKTAETGAMQHRMIKAFENVIIGNDGSIRNTIGTMFSPIYNSGYDIGEMMAVETLGKPDLASFIDIKSVVAELNIERGWVPANVNASISNQRIKVVDEIGSSPENVLTPPPPSYVSKGPVLQNTTVVHNIEEPVVVPSLTRKLTKFEKARIVGTRSVQLSNNAPPLLDIDDEIDPVKIALMEYDAGILDLYIVRRFADGSYQKVYPTLENI